MMRVHRSLALSLRHQVVYTQAQVQAPCELVVESLHDIWDTVLIYKITNNSIMSDIHRITFDTLELTVIVIYCDIQDSRCVEHQLDTLMYCYNRGIRLSNVGVSHLPLLPLIIEVARLRVPDNSVVEPL